MSVAALNRPAQKSPSEETLGKMSASMKANIAAKKAAGTYVPPPIGEAHGMFGKTHTAETKARLKEIQNTPEYKENQAEYKRNWWANNPEAEETRRRMSESAKKRAPISEETRARMSAAVSARHAANRLAKQTSKPE